MEQRVKSYSNDIEAVRASLTAHQADLAASLASIETVSTKLQGYERKREEANQLLGQISSLSGDLGTYQNRTVDDLRSEVAECTKELKSLEGVNKKAMEQYRQLTEQFQDLSKRFSECEKGDESIHDLVAHLDQRKDASIKQAFDSVSVHFADTFRELVPNGTATMQLAEENLSLLVSFNGDTQLSQLSQLSGGQKTIVALAMLFAMQRFEPAPFYLFDEIDAALDNEYRSAVASLVVRESQRTQVLCTTFRPELVQAAAAHFRVQLKLRASVVERVDVNAAFEVVAAGSAAATSARNA
jgi:structural maintenance of chromosome 3 (chondroitin sulfate proteoglycan 6)